MAPDDRSGSPRLPEDVAHRLLARAVELDASAPQEMTIERLREAAREAGISLAAFDAALAELQQSDLRANAASVGPAHGFLKRLRAWTGWSFGSLGDAVIRNGVAFAATWGILVLLVSVGRLAGVEWLARKAIDPVALALGAAVAARLRARPAGILLAGLAISTAAEFLMDAVFGVPAVRGSGSHWALIVAGVAGVLVGSRLLRQPPRHDAAMESPLPSNESRDPAEEPPARRERALLLRLRPVDA